MTPSPYRVDTDRLMAHATLDRVLAVLVVAMAATGLLTLRAGTAETAWVYVLHGVLAGALLAATVVKLRRSVPRAVEAGRWRRLLLAALVSLGTIAALSGGFLWVTSGQSLSIGSWTVLTLHAWVGLALVPLVVLHLLPTRWRLLRPAPSGAPRRGRVLARRTVLAAGGLALVGVATVGVTGAIDQLRGGTRRFTGSRWLPAGGVPPPTTFFGEGPPSIDIEGWRVRLTDARGVERSLSLADLQTMGAVERSVVLDCTSGWAMDTTWRGVPLPVVLAQEVAPRPWMIRSATGWATVLSADEVADSILAWDVAGSPLPAFNGAPLRLVVPSRRGLDWVKWVSEIRPA
jgi:hypothetical protein